MLYDVSLPALVATVGASQLIALALLWRTLRPAHVWMRRRVPPEA